MEESIFCFGYEGQGARLITLKNNIGTEVSFTNYGARWVDMKLSEKFGKNVQVVLGFDSLQAYFNAGEQYHGAMVGRVCGRISGAHFTLNGINYQLNSNDAYGKPVKNHLHGGYRGFHNRFWKVISIETSPETESVTFGLFSPSGEEGYPGNLDIRVKYSLLSESDKVILECYVTTDEDTVVNITNHAFFNLAGHSKNMCVNDHKVVIDSEYLIECDSELIPTGRLIPMDSAFADFSGAVTIGEAIASGDEQVRADGGFTIGLALDGFDEMGSDGRGCRRACHFEDAGSGRFVEVFTNRPSLQIYNGYFMDGKDIGHNEVRYHSGAGLAIEPQDFPDAPNRLEFPSVVVRRDSPYYQRTEYVFGEKNG